MISLEDNQRSEQPAGSLSEGEPVFLVVGKIRRPHGVRGEFILEIYTDFPERLRQGVPVFVGESRRKIAIRSARPNGDTLLVAFDGLNSPEEARVFTNQLVYVRADDRPALPDGEYYHHQLLGLQVVGEEGQVLGTLSEILDLPANDVYVVRSESGSEILLPAVDPFIQAIDLQRREIRVKIIPGLLPE